MALTKLPKDGLATGSVSTSQIEDGTVQNQEFEDSTLTSAKLADSTIANAKLSNSSFTINSTAVNLGASITANANVDWQSVITSNTTMVANRGYFVNTTSGAITMTLPSSASIGDTISIKDYAGTFATNNLTIARNSHKIQGATLDSALETNRASVTLVYVDATKGWLFTDEHNVADLEGPAYTSATGGNIVTTHGDDKIHVFTSSGNFVVSSIGNSGGSPSAISYLVIAGGGGGGGGHDNGTAGGAGGGGGGYRTGGTYGPSPLRGSTITVSSQTYPITVGAGGSGGPANQPGGTAPNNNGSTSTFSTITAAGGGGGGGGNYPSTGGSGGSGGGAARAPGSAGAGNTPPVSPPQGNPGGGSHPSTGAGGGGIGGSGSGGGSSSGGTGAPNLIWPTSAATPISGNINANGTNWAHGRDGAPSSPSSPGTAGDANQGNGGSGGGGNNGAGGNAGSGVVILRYKYQN